MRHIIRAFDRLLCRCQGVFVYWDDPDCFFRAQIARASRDIVLPDSQISAGAKILKLHFWNEHMPVIPPEGPDLAQALHASRMIVSSFRVLASDMPGDPRLADVRALGGATVLFAAGDDSSGEKLFKRLGFTMFPHQNPLGRFGEFWENLYTWALMWAYNAVSLRQRRFLALRRTESWMSTDGFLRRYGADRNRPHHHTADRAHGSASRTRHADPGIGR